MITQIVLFVLLSTGSVFCAAFFRRRYEELAFITCCSIVLLLFLFGILGILEVGFYAVLVFCLAAYVLSFVKVVCERTFKDFSRCIFTPAFFFFALCFAVFSVLNYGRLISAWDEFSHWGDVVKAMVQLNDFGTNPASGSFFKSYPPSMSLFQYFAEKLTMLMEHRSDFCEWRLYFSYQIFVIAAFLPFLKNMRLKHLALSVISMMALCLAPMFFFPNSYSEIYIDPAMSVLAGAGLAAVFTHGKNDIIYKLYVFLTAAVLLLIKDAGILFSVFLVAAFLLDEIFTQKSANTLGAYMKKNFPLQLFCGTCAIFIPKLLWSLNMSLNNASRWFTGKVDFRQLLMILLNRDTSYRSTLLLQFFVSFFDGSITIGDTGITMSFAALLACTIALLYFLYISWRNDDATRRPARKALVWLVLGMFAVYFFGLVVVYMFKFSEYEGGGMTSYVRYMSIPFSAVWAMAMLIWVEKLQQNCYSKLGAALLCVLAIMTPWYSAGQFLSRSSVGSSIEIRQPYFEATEKVMGIVQEQPSNIYVVTQNSEGIDWLIMAFNLRPNFTRGGWISEPRYEGDTNTLNKTAQEWRTMLAADYDYVLLYQLDDYFFENYASAFAKKADIMEGCLYSVNKTTQLLELCV